MLFRNKRRKFLNQELTQKDLHELLTYYGIPVDSFEILPSTALKVIVVYICIKILSDTMSKLPCKIYQDNGGIRKATDHYLYPLLKLRPNPYMSASDFWKCLEVQRNLYGNSYVWIDFTDTGRIAGLYPLNSAKMQIFVDDVGLISSKNSVWYIYTDDAGNQYKIQSHDLLHFKGLTTNGLVGLNPIETLKLNIDNAAAAGQFLNNSYKNGLQTAGIIHYVGDLSEQAEETFRQKFEKMANGLKNANRVSLLPIGFTYEPIALRLTDAQFLENVQLTEREIAAAFGIKLHQLNDLTKTSYASTSEANREFYVDTLMAILNMYEQELTYKLFLPKEILSGYYVKFNADVILRADIKTRYEAYAIAIQNGIKTPNEVRALEEDPPLEGGDQLLLNGNMIPATMAGDQYKK